MSTVGSREGVLPTRLDKHARPDRQTGCGNCGLPKRQGGDSTFDGQVTRLKYGANAIRNPLRIAIGSQTHRIGWLSPGRALDLRRLKVRPAFSAIA